MTQETSQNSQASHDHDQLESSSAADDVVLVKNHIALESEQYQMHRVAILPSQILTDAIARLRFTIVLVSFFYSGLFFVFGILAICLLVPDVLYMLDRNSPILLNMARIMISLLAIGLACGCIAIAMKQRGLTSKLALAEVMIDTIRDQTMIQMQATRYSLEDLTDRLKMPKEENHASAFDYIDLAKRIGPVISLLMAKERSVVTIAVEGLKFFQAFKKVLKR